MFLAFFYSLLIVKFSQVSLSLSHSHVDMAELAFSAAINLFERFSTRLSISQFIWALSDHP